MPRKKRNLPKDEDMFAATSEDTANDLHIPDAPTFEAVDRAGYGHGPLDLGDKVNVHQIAIDQIEPDPQQPRRAIPRSIYEQWNGDLETLFTTWQAVIRAYNSAFDLAALLDESGDLSLDPDEKDITLADPALHPAERALRRIIALAASIRHNGLINPITVINRPTGGFYLETGERRWLAHHLLWQHTEDSRWKKIPARKFQTLDVWRQASENNARDNLNAIGKARQLAILIMDLQEEAQFQPLANFENEQDYYRQAAESRIPRGTGEKLLNALGVEHRSAISRYRALLNLPYEVWTLADEYDWPEGKLREFVDLAENEAIEKARREAGMLPTGNVSPGAMLPTGNISRRKRTPRYERMMSKDIPRLKKNIQRLKPEQRETVIEELRRLLMELESA